MKLASLLIIWHLMSISLAASDSLKFNIPETVEVLDDITRRVQKQMHHFTDNEQTLVLLLQQSGLANHEKIEALVQYELLKKNRSDFMRAAELERLKARYKLGLDLLRLLYEKILALDHHFASMKTNQNINDLSNPHSYRAFSKTSEIIEKQLKKKFAVALPPILNTNPYISTAYSIISVILTEVTPSHKEEHLADISCVLDFTVRMHGELNVIRFETEYLRDANADLKLQLEDLFKDYVESINYLVSLDRCRSSDDWEKVEQSLEKKIESISSKKVGKSDSDWINLEFAIGKVINFINSYNVFISQGSKYYKKFQRMVDGYAATEICLASLPTQFEQLKAEINTAIEKFERSYKLPELSGSKLKDLLFGNID